jgi:hypothetical protein
MIDPRLGDSVGLRRSATAADRRQVLSEPEGVSPRRKILDPTDEFVAVAFVQVSSLEVVGKMDTLTAPPCRCLGFGSGDQLGGKAATPEVPVDPEALKLAAVAPGPPADTGHDLAGLADEYRQVDFVTESRCLARLSADLQFQELDIQWIRPLLNVEGQRIGSNQTSTICSTSETSSK